MPSLLDRITRPDSSSGIGGPWSALSDTFGVSGGQIYKVSTTATNGFATVDPGVGSGDCLISMLVPTYWGTANNGGLGIIFRVTDVNNLYVADFGTTAPALYKEVSGSFSNLGGLSSTLASGDLLQVLAVKSRIECRRIRAGVVTSLLTVTDSTYGNTLHKHGIFLYGADAVSRIGSFQVTAISDLAVSG